MAGQHLLDLLPVARELSEVNKAVQKRESILRQLSILRNVSDLLKKSSSNGIEQLLFSFELIVVPSLESEIVNLIIRHLLPGYDLDPGFWSFHVTMPGGMVHRWSLPKSFIAGDCERFSIPFVPEFIAQNDFRQWVEVNLVFCIQWADLSYTTSFIVYQSEVDILYVLNPGRRPMPPSPVVRFGNMEEVWNKYPPITRFSIVVNSKMLDIFLPMILLRNSQAHRGFDNSLILTPDFSVYFGSDKITVVVEKSEIDVHVLTIVCPNPRILWLIKCATYRRLLKLYEENVLEIKGGPDESFDIICDLKLRLESLTLDPDGGGRDCSEDVAGRFLSFYHELRAASESAVQFHYL